MLLPSQKQQLNNNINNKKELDNNVTSGTATNSIAGGSSSISSGKTKTNTTKLKQLMHMMPLHFHQ